MYYFCTITTIDYLPFVQTLFHSLKQQSENITLHVLVLANEKPPGTGFILYYTPNDLSDGRALELTHKYKTNADYLRWGLKPVFIQHLLNKCEQVIYVDNDIYFFNPFDFLFEQLLHHSLLLTPHWSSFSPFPFDENFMTAYQIGLFNAGFVGANRKALTILKWWSDACLYSMESDFCRGFFVDQRYLDLSLVIDPEVGIVRHLGCNLGSWNMHQNKRVKLNEKVLIAGKYPVVFIHFNNETITHILNGNDQLLRSYFTEYEQAFSLTGYQLNDFKHRAKPHLIIQIKRKLLFRTRLKRFLFQLSQKI